jgi:isocitrate lyase
MTGTPTRWKGIKRGYTAADVERLRGSVQVEHTLARQAPKNCGTWSTTNLHQLSGRGRWSDHAASENGIKAIYLSGWQVAADNNEYSAMYPDQSLYPVDSVPKVVERINNAFTRADEIQHSRACERSAWFC